MKVQMILDNTFAFAQQHKKIACTRTRERGILLTINYILFCNCMDQHSPSHASTSFDNKNSSLVLSPRLSQLEKIANRLYKGLLKEADESDLAQFTETKAAVGWSRAAELLTGAALFAAATNEKKDIQY